MSEERKGFIVYGDIKEVIDELSDDQVAALFRGMVDYFVEGKKPKFSGSLKYIFITIRQQMDRDAEKYERKCEKMRENANKRWGKNKKSEDMQLHANDANTNTKTNIDTKTGRDINTKPPESGDSSPKEKLYFFADID